MGQHQLTASNTLWLFVSCSGDARHLDDVIFAVSTLRKRGVPDERLLVFVDHPKQDAHFRPYGIVAFPVHEFETRISGAAPAEYAVAIVGGHGHVGGLGSTPKPPAVTPVLAPHSLFAALRRLPTLKVGVIALTQCFGGVYNFTDAAAAPPLTILGATNLNPSLSMSITVNPPLTQVDGSQGLSSWEANIFGLFFFNWLGAPVDIDGDGQLTLMDAYKLAGARSNEILRSAKAQLFRDAQQIEKDLRATDSAITDQRAKVLALNPPDPALVAELLRLTMQRDAQDRGLKQALENLYLHQEPWILNANLAREIHFT